MNIKNLKESSSFLGCIELNQTYWVCYVNSQKLTQTQQIENEIKVKVSKGDNNRNTRYRFFLFRARST